jgi:hypothetical protein
VTQQSHERRITVENYPVKPKAWAVVTHWGSLTKYLVSLKAGR